MKYKMKISGSIWNSLKIPILNIFSIDSCKSQLNFRSVFCIISKFRIYLERTFKIEHNWYEESLGVRNISTLEICKPLIRNSRNCFFLLTKIHIQCCEPSDSQGFFVPVVFSFDCSFQIYSEVFSNREHRRAGTSTSTTSKSILLVL